MSKLYVVGLGPGSEDFLTPRAAAALENSDIIYGYTVYIDLIKQGFSHKEMRTTGMRQEVERCRLALLAAAEGSNVSMVCSGDPGVYGMAGLILQMAPDFPSVDVEIVPGITAATAGAAVLGAPLGHDFAVISLSDLLTPWELIEKRLFACAEADMIICLYNPQSRKRRDYLQRACDILGRALPGDRVCGWVRNIGRDGEQAHITTLSELPASDVDMFTTVFIGSSTTSLQNGRMVTPRGYRGLEE